MNSLSSLAAGLVTLSISAVVIPTSAAAVGSLAFSDGTDDFFSEVSPGAGDMFDVEFNPFNLNFVTTQNGFFTPPFDGFPVQGIPSSMGFFSYVSSAGNSFFYELTSDLVFAYDNGATVTFATGSLFEGIFNGPSSVEFELLSTGLVSVTGIGETVIVTSESLQFAGTSSLGGGTYSSQVDVAEPLPPIPLPATGPLAAAALAGLYIVRRRRS